MALADPQSVTIEGAAVSLPRTGFSELTGRFTSADAEYELEILHSPRRAARHRHEVRLTLTKMVSSPTVPDQNMQVSASAYLVVNFPKLGVEVDEMADFAAAVSAWCTEANLLKVITGQS